MLQRLRKAIRRGARLVAVSAAVSGCLAPTSELDAGREDAGRDDAGQVRRDAGTPTKLPPTEPLCVAPTYDAGPLNQCCRKVGCYVHDGGGCVEANVIAVQRASRDIVPPGSGTCTCSIPLEGPFLGRDGGTSECCYTVGSIGCTGRPLTAAGEQLVAAVVSRGDWA